THILEPKAYLILAKSTDTSKFQIFGEVVAPSAWTALTNGGDNMGLRSASGTLIDTVDYSSSWYGDELKDDGGWTLERVNPNASNCPAFGNWRASEDVTGGTPGRENSIFSEAPDTDAPQIASIILQSPTELLVCFNEAMDVPNLENVSHFSVGNGLGNPATATALSPDNQCVILTWATAFPQGKEYTLTVSGVEDCSGNTLVSSATINFIVGKDAQPFEVVMNELFFDPSPSNGLPESEFVELYNRTSEILSLNGWQFSDGGSPAVIKNAQLLPNEYAILCHQDDSLDWAAFGKVIAVESFPGLNNSGDSLWLRNAQGDLMDFVFYSSKWHENAEKAAGGWTLERIDPDFVNCNHERNWWSSQNLGLGGTPGAVNSVNAEFTDLKTPKLQGIRVVASANQVVLTFSESLDAGFSTDENNYDIQPAIGNPLVALSDFPETNIISLLLGAALDPDILYTLTISNLQDCAGNVFSGKFRFGIPKSPTEGDVLINEILFNAHTGGSDFLEIYNASNKV
ncbi:MAG: lamin tail domain-containing protein, partial [Methylococcales bacterium]|nr:lamin tail domain-containing protein [Methylococcales bacterium]